MTDDLVSKIVSIYFQRQCGGGGGGVEHPLATGEPLTGGGARRGEERPSLLKTPPSLILMRLFPDTSLHFSLRLNGSSVLLCTALLLAVRKGGTSEIA